MWFRTTTNTRSVTPVVWLMLAAAFSVMTAAQRDYEYNGSGGNEYANDGGGSGDSYQDYADPYTQPDNLYADYAAQKMDAAGGGGGG
jgi:hypothetical protein